MGAVSKVANDAPPSEQQDQGGRAACKPPRLIFAGLCLRCDARDCNDPVCIAWYVKSYWAICPECDGLCWTQNIVPCGCCFGVVEAYPPSSPTRLAAV
jgi:hypothetical protein